LQAPFASQLLFPVQRSGSSALVTATQVPPPPVHAWQLAHDAVPQQWPSTHAPLVHSAAPVHVWPLAFLHAPAASQACIPLQVSSMADLTALHVPGAAARLQAWQVPAQAALQQYPSAQNPLVHSAAAPHFWPVAFLATHTPAAQ
jgi:hypothetical protein